MQKFTSPAEASLMKKAMNVRPRPRTLFKTEESHFQILQAFGLLAEFGNQFGITCDEGLMDDSFYKVCNTLKSIGVHESFLDRMDETVSKVFLLQTCSGEDDCVSSCDYRDVCVRNPQPLAQVLDVLGVAESDPASVVCA